MDLAIGDWFEYLDAPNLRAEMLAPGTPDRGPLFLIVGERGARHIPQKELDERWIPFVPPDGQVPPWVQPNVFFIRRDPLILQARVSLWSIHKSWVAFHYVGRSADSMGVFEMASWEDFRNQWEAENRPTAWEHLLADLEAADA